MTGIAALIAMRAGVSQNQVSDLRQFRAYNGTVLGTINGYGNLATGQSTNTDQAGILAASGTTVSYTWKNPNYTNHPVCSLTPESDPGSGVRYYITYTSTTSFTAHFTSSYTGNVDYICIPRN